MTASSYRKLISTPAAISGDIEARRIADGVGAADDMAAGTADGRIGHGVDIAVVDLDAVGVEVAAAGRAGVAGDRVARRVGADIGVIALAALEGGGDVDAALFNWLLSILT